MKTYIANPRQLEVSCLGCGEKTKTRTAYCSKCQKTTVRGVKRDKVKGEDITNCLGCGRDTTNLSGYCNACIKPGFNNIREKEGRHILRMWDGDNATVLSSIHEDSYGEESSPFD